MTIVMSYLFKTYSFSKVESSDAIDRFFREFGWMDPNIFSFILKSFVAEGHEYFPTPEEVREHIEDMRDQAKYILNDPRNRFYKEISEEAGERRRQKLIRASEFLKRTERNTHDNNTRYQLNG